MCRQNANTFTPLSPGDNRCADAWLHTPAACSTGTHTPSCILPRVTPPNDFCDTIANLLHSTQVRFSHWIMSHAWAWERDLQRLNDLEKRVKVRFLHLFLYVHSFVAAMVTLLRGSLSL
jgi:hypothetical protein